nr:putative ribonuclease H-like domain-containing protein [Tanacetum cinerariifolium]
IFGNACDDEAVEEEVDMNNVVSSYTIPDAPLTKFLKDHPKDQVFRNKKDERGIVIKNKARLVAQGHTQEEGIYYDELFAPVARIEAIRLFLAYASFKDFVVYQLDSPFDLEAYSNRNYVGSSLDNKSTTGGCQFHGKRLISWQCKKQTIVANSTIEAEYVAVASCCGQVLWIQNQMLNYGFNLMNTKIYIDNETKDGRCFMDIFAVKTGISSLNTGGQRTQSMATLNEPLPRGTGLGSGPRCQVTILGGAEAQTRFEVASKQSNDSPLSRGHTLRNGEDSIKLKRIDRTLYKIV